jgi:hypothetical protein
MYNIRSNMGECLTPPISEPIGNRAPPALRECLRKMWKQHFHTDGVVFHGRSFYNDYPVYYWGFALAIEQLTDMGLVTNKANIVDPNGELIKNASEEAWNDFIAKKSLTGTKILVVGGPEARVFAEMGATAIGIDPFILSVPSVKHRQLNLVETPGILDKEIALQLLGGWADLAFSHWLFDSFSGIGDPTETMSNILTATRIGGRGIHNGNLTLKAIKTIQSITSLRSFIPLRKEEAHVSFSTPYVVLERI